MTQINQVNWKTEEMKSLLIKTIEGSSGYTQAAARLSKVLNRPINRNQVIGAITRLKIDKSPEAKEYKEKHTWTPERLDLLRRYHAEGFTDHMIATKINRETSSDFNNESVRAKRTKIGVARAAKRQPDNRLYRAKKTKPLPESRPVAVLPRDPMATHPYAQCKWIDGDPKGAYTVCAQPAAINVQGNARPYCPHHCAIAYVPPGDSRRRARAESFA